MTATLAIVAAHLWQSTLFAAVISGMALALRKQSGGVRHVLWMTASLKFLVPFAALVAIGSLFGFRSPVPATIHVHREVVSATNGGAPWLPVFDVFAPAALSGDRQA